MPHPTAADQGARSGSRTLPMTVYLLYLLGMLMVITAPVGVLIAHIARGRAMDWMRSHYTFQIRTFWLGLPALLVGLFLTINVIGYLIIAAWMIWAVARCAAGISYLADYRPVPDPKSLWIGRGATR